jgi:hypothetical protein
VREIIRRGEWMKETVRKMARETCNGEKALRQRAEGAMEGRDG